MITRKVKIQVIVFAVVGVIAVVYGAMRYAGIGTSLINPTYNVRLELANSGGIFTNAEVTYRGVNVGKVTDMTLTQTGLEVDLQINRSAPQIPSDLKAAVADRSAVGEQYVDLVPNTTAGPYLTDNSVIAQQDTSTPLPTQDLLTNLDSLANSVPTKSLQTVVDELDTGLSGTGPDLQKLLDSVSDLTATAQQQLPQTTQLLDTGKTVLDTQNVESGAIESFSGSLEQLSATLKSSDPQIRNLIATAPQAAMQITDLLDETGPNLGAVIANLLTTSNILITRQSNLDEAFVAYPEVVGAAGTVLPGDGTAHLGLALNFFNPPPCVTGYQGTPHRAGNVTTPAAPNLNAYCSQPAGSPTDVRGAENAPYGGSPGAPAAGSSGGTQPTTPSPSQSSTGGGGLFDQSGGAVSVTSLAQLLGIG